MVGLTQQEVDYLKHWAVAAYCGRKENCVTPNEVSAFLASDNLCIIPRNRSSGFSDVYMRKLTPSQSKVIFLDSGVQYATYYTLKKLFPEHPDLINSIAITLADSTVQKKFLEYAEPYLKPRLAQVSIFEIGEEASVYERMPILKLFNYKNYELCERFAVTLKDPGIISFGAEANIPKGADFYWCCNIGTSADMESITNMATLLSIQARQMEAHSTTIWVDGTGRNIPDFYNHFQPVFGLTPQSHDVNHRDAGSLLVVKKTGDCAPRSLNELGTRMAAHGDVRIVSFKESNDRYNGSQRQGHHTAELSRPAPPANLKTH